MDGALLIDKPAGISSFAVVARVRRALKIKRVGHSGTLDPFATGLLVVLLGKATRLQSIFLNARKSYEGEIALGIATESLDITGAVTETAPLDSLTPLALSEGLALARQKLSGKLLQSPPSISAIKIDGKRSYERARAGEEANPAPREIEIYRIELTPLVAEDRPGTERIKIQVDCSKGTYIRSIARDVGKILGVPACLASLRRTASSPFSVGNAQELTALEQLGVAPSSFISMSQLAALLPIIALSSADCERLRLGDQAPLASIHIEPTAHPDQLFSITDSTGALRGLAELRHTARDDGATRGLSLGLRCVLS